MKNLFAILAFVAFLPVSVHGSTINYVGSSTVGKFITDASAVFAGATFKIDTKPESGGGEVCAAIGNCDIGGVARDVNQKYRDRGVEATLIGKDAIAVIVHKDNPVNGLTAGQLRDIFTGRIKNWSEVGGPDLVITPLIVKKGSATRKVFAKAILNGVEYEGTDVVMPDAKIPIRVGLEKGAVGQISFAFIIGNSKVKALAVDGQEADVNNSGYPITRPLHLVTNGTPKGDVKAFIDWALSSEGQALVKQRFVGVK